MNTNIVYYIAYMYCLVYNVYDLCMNTRNIHLYEYVKFNERTEMFITFQGEG